MPVSLGTLREIADDLECLGQETDAAAVHDAIAEISALRAAQVGAGDGAENERVRHLKRGTEYEVLYRGVELQISYAPVMESSKLAIYRGADGKLWAREEQEFDDGRFVTVRARVGAGERQATAPA
jgi:hypothetical protein